MANIKVLHTIVYPDCAIIARCEWHSASFSISISGKSSLGLKQTRLWSQDSVESKDSLQSLAAPVKKEVEPDTKDIKIQEEAENSSSKSDSDSSDRDDDDDDYEDDEFPPVHIKLPLQLDLDDIAGVSASFHLRDPFICRRQFHKKV